MGLGKTYSTKYLLDSNNSSGVAGQVLSTTSTGIDWVDSGTLSTGLWLKNGDDIYNSNSGSVGIGVTSLSDWGWIIDHALQFANGAFVAGRTDATAAINLGANAFVTATGGNAWKYFDAGAATRYVQQVGQHYFQTAPAGAAAGDAITWSTALNILNNGNSIFTNSVSIGTTVSPTRTLDVRGTGLNIFGSGGSTELMLRGQVEGTGTVRDLGSWHLSVRGDVAGDNDDLKLLRFITGTYAGWSMVVQNTTGNMAIGTNTLPGNYRLIIEDADEDILRLHNKTDGLDALITFSNPGGTLGRIQGIDNGGLGFDVGNNAGGIVSNAMFIKNNGNVGIGTTLPGSKLTVSGSFSADTGYFSSALTLASDLRLQSNITILNKAQTSYISFATRNTTGSEVVMDLTNVGSINGGAAGPYLPLSAGASYPLTDTLYLATASNLGKLQFGTANSDYYIRGGGNYGYININGPIVRFDTNASERMRITSAGDVGIGTTSPSSKFTVSGSDASNWISRIENTSSSNPQGLVVSIGAQTSAYATFGVYSDSAYQFVVGGDGNVGIGTTLPTTALTIRKAISPTAYGEQASMIEFKSYYTGYDTETVKSAIYSGVSSLTGLQTARGFMSFWTSSYLAAGTENLTEKMRIESNGNVGIGTTSPQAKLHVSDTTRIDGILFTRDINAGYYALAADLTLRSGTSGRTLINPSGGNVGIGTTTPTAGKLQIEGADDTSLLNLSLSGGYSKGSLEIDDPYFVVKSTSNTTGGIKFRTITGGTTYDRMTILNSGNVGIGEDTPLSSLHVSGPAGNRFTEGLRVERSTVPAQFAMFNYNGGSLNIIATNTAGTGTSMKFQKSNDGSALTDHMVIDNSGNVGIGVTGPTSKLQVNYSAAPSFNANGGANALTLVRDDSGGDINEVGAGLVFAQRYINTATASIGVGGIYGVKTIASGSFGGGLAFYTQPFGSGSMDRRMIINHAGAIKFNNYDSTNNTGTPTYVLGTDASGNVVKVLGADIPGTGGANNWTLSGTDIYKNNSGNVGIGATSPNELLHILGSNATALIQGSGTSSTAGVDFFPRDVSNVAHLQSIKGVSDELRFLTGGTPANNYVPTERMSIDGSGNVTIGTNNTNLNFKVNTPSLSTSFPSYFQVTGSYTGTISDIDIKAVGVLSGGGYGSNLKFFTSNEATLSEKMRINSSGNVGIGVTPFTNSLTSGVGVDLKSNAGLIGYANAMYVSSNVYYNSGWKYKSTGTAALLQVGSTSGTVSLRQAASGTVNQAVSFTQTLTIDNTGNVGIGTTLPGTKLDVRGNGYFLGTAASGAALVTIENNSGSTATSYGLLVIGGGNSSNGRTFEVRDGSGNVDLIVKGHGNVGIGTTEPQSKLDIVQPDSSASTLGQSATASLGIRMANAIGQVGQIVFNNDAAPNYGYGSIGMIMTSGSGVGLGDMIFSTKSTGVANPSTERMRITSSGQVNIATPITNAFYGLSLQYNSLDTAEFKVNQATGQIKIGGVATGYFPTFYSAGTEKMRITTGGNVGIGTTTPGDRLHVKPTTGEKGVVVETMEAGQGFLFYPTGYSETSGSSYFRITGAPGVSHSLELGTSSNNGISFQTAGSTKMTILGGGNVGIGTTGPAVPLDVEGKIRSSNDNSGSYLEMFNDGDVSGNSFITSTSGEMIIKSPDDITFLTNSSERIRIDGGGEVGINETSPSATLHLTALSSSGVPFKLVGDPATTTVQQLIRTEQYSTSITAWYNIVCEAKNSSNNIVSTFIVERDGDVKNANNVYGQISDIRLKENILDATPKLEDIKKLKVKNFNFIGDELKQIGLIAQEVEEIFPGLVKEDMQPGPDGTKGGVYKSVKYSIFVPMMIKAMQEQQEIIENLTTRIEQLEN